MDRMDIDDGNTVQNDNDDDNDSDEDDAAELEQWRQKEEAESQKWWLPIRNEEEGDEEDEDPERVVFYHDIRDLILPLSYPVRFRGQSALCLTYTPRNFVKKPFIYFWSSWKWVFHLAFPQRRNIDRFVAYPVLLLSPSHVLTGSKEVAERLQDNSHALRIFQSLLGVISDDGELSEASSTVNRQPLAAVDFAKLDLGDNLKDQAKIDFVRRLLDGVQSSLPKDDAHTFTLVSMTFEALHSKDSAAAKYGIPIIERYL